MTSSSSDNECLERLLEGDERAFEALIDEYHTGMLKFASTFVDGESAAEEVVQETWAAVVDGLEDFEGRSSLKTWIYGILANIAKKRGRRDGRTVNWSSLSDEPIDDRVTVDSDRFNAEGHWSVPPKSWNRDPEDDLLRSDLLEQIERALEDLPARQQAVVRLRDVEGLSTDDVCDILDITQGNQRVLLHRGRTKIRSALEQYLAGGREVPE